MFAEEDLAMMPGDIGNENMGTGDTDNVGDGPFRLLVRVHTYFKLFRYFLIVISLFPFYLQRG